MRRSYQLPRTGCGKLTFNKAPLENLLHQKNRIKSPFPLTFAPIKQTNLRRVIAIFLLSLQLFTGTELCQLFKAPVLFEHYREHKGGDKNLSFLSFLREHYFNNDERNPDYARDMQLPFKSCIGVCHATHSISIPIPGFTNIPPVPAFEIEKQYHCFQGVWQPSQIVHTIFQPPRFAVA